PQVYVVGLEENLFPSQRSLSSRSDLEEERRLFYVAITRAEKKLYLSYATSRYKWGSLHNCEPSRFLDELDPQYLDLDFNPKQRVSTSFLDKEKGNSQSQDTFSKPKPRIIPKTTTLLPKAHVPTAGFTPSNTSNLQVGMDVEHERFGF